MNPTLEKIKTDESVWPEGASHYIDGDFTKWIEGDEYCWAEKAKEWVAEFPSWSLEEYIKKEYEIIPRPTKADKDWLQVNSKVMTPKGAATVNKITEDDGVFTTLGNYCRSELSPNKAFVPEVGVECELELSSGKAIKIIPKYISEDFIVFFDVENNKERCEYAYGKFRPIKYEREKFVETGIEINKSLGMGATEKSMFEALYDSGKFKLVEPTK